MFVPGETGALRAVEKDCPVARLLGRSKEFKADSRIELNPWLLRGVDVDILEPLGVQRVASSYHWSFELPPGWLRTKGTGEKPSPQVRARANSACQVSRRDPEIPTTICVASPTI